MTGARKPGKHGRGWFGLGTTWRRTDDKSCCVSGQDCSVPLVATALRSPTPVYLIMIVVYINSCFMFSLACISWYLL